MATATSKQSIENEIRNLTQAWASAVEAKDVDAILTHYSDDARVFDVPPPLEVNGKEAYRTRWEQWLSMFSGPVKCEFKNLQIVAGEDVAFAHTLTRVSEEKSGPESGSWVRVTVGFQKIGGEWLATHEHVSLPFNGQNGE